MNEIFIYFIITVIVVSTIMTHHNTKKNYKRADKIQQSLNEYIKKEREHHAK